MACGEDGAGNSYLIFEGDFDQLFLPGFRVQTALFGGMLEAGSRYPMPRTAHTPGLHDVGQSLQQDFVVSLDVQTTFQLQLRRLRFRL